MGLVTKQRKAEKDLQKLKEKQAKEGEGGDLTYKQRNHLDIIMDFMELSDMFPSYEQIAKVTGRSRADVQQCLKAIYIKTGSAFLVQQWTIKNMRNVPNGYRISRHMSGLIFQMFRFEKSKVNREKRKKLVKEVLGIQ